MKRVLAILAVMLLPLSVWAMTPINDSQLSDVTGQAGVSINFDVTMTVEFGDLGWGDSDGALGGGAGWVGLDSFKMGTLHIWPRTDYTMDSNENTVAGDGDWSDLKLLTIDVTTVPYTALGATDPLYDNFTGNHLTSGYVTAVVIGVPTLTLTMDFMEGNVVLGTNGGASSIGGKLEDAGLSRFVGEKLVNAPAFNQLLGKFYVGKVNMATAGGNILIFAHGARTTAGAHSPVWNLAGSGVTIALQQVTVSYILVDTVSWGDIDGQAYADPTYSNLNTGGLMGEGWVGLSNLAIDGMVINGAIAIDVGTVIPGSSAGAYYDTWTSVILPAGWDTYDPDTWNSIAGWYWPQLIAVFNDAYETVGYSGQTFVSIGIVDGFYINMGKMGAQVKLGANRDFTSAGSKIMGDIYIGGMKVTIHDNPLLGTKSFVHIFAH